MDKTQAMDRANELHADLYWHERAMQVPVEERTDFHIACILPYPGAVRAEYVKLVQRIEAGEFPPERGAYGQTIERGFVMHEDAWMFPNKVPGAWFQIHCDGYSGAWACHEKMVIVYYSEGDITIERYAQGQYAIGYEMARAFYEAPSNADVFGTADDSPITMDMLLNIFSHGGEHE